MTSMNVTTAVRGRGTRQAVLEVQDLNTLLSLMRLLGRVVSGMLLTTSETAATSIPLIQWLVNTYSPISKLFSLFASGIPVVLKGAILDTLAAFSSSVLVTEVFPAPILSPAQTPQQVGAEQWRYTGTLQELIWSYVEVHHIVPRVNHAAAGGTGTHPRGVPVHAAGYTHNNPHAGNNSNMSFHFMAVVRRTFILCCIERIHVSMLVIHVLCMCRWFII